MNFRSMWRLSVNQPRRLPYPEAALLRARSRTARTFVKPPLTDRTYSVSNDIRNRPFRVLGASGLGGGDGMTT